DGVLLVLAVDDLAHAFDEEAVLVVGEEGVPVAAPDDLDAIPAGAAEGGFEFLNDLAVAPDRSVEPLQVAIDDEDQVVESLARGECECAQRFRLVGLAIAEETPDLLRRRFAQSAVRQVAGEPRLVNRQDRAE